MKSDIDAYKLKVLKVSDNPPVFEYSATFCDGEGVEHTEYISKNVYAVLKDCQRRTRNLVRRDERHTEQSEQTEESIAKRSLLKSVSPEDKVIADQWKLCYEQALAQLPEMQRRRFLLYCENGMTFCAIAQLEGCSDRAIQYSVDIAKEKIKKVLRNFEK